MTSATAQARRHRPSEALEDGRRWSWPGGPEFATFIEIVRVEPSELDVVEIGMRAAVRYADEIVDRLQAQAYQAYTVLHPCEMARLGAAHHGGGEAR